MHNSVNEGTYTVTAGIVAVAVGGITVLGTTLALPIGAIGVAIIVLGLAVGGVFEWANAKLGQSLGSKKGISATDLLKNYLTEKWKQAIEQAQATKDDTNYDGGPIFPDGPVP